MSADDEKASYQLFGGIEAPRNTRERILFTATELFYTHGIHAVGLDRILEAADLTKTTFYNHFPSKDDLVVEALELRDRWEGEAFLRDLHAKAGYAPRDLLLGCFDVLHDWFTAPEYQGCLFLMAVTDHPVRSHPAHQAAAKHYLVTRQTIEKMAAAAGARDPAELARQWSILLLGAVSQQLMAPELEPARQARRMAELILETELDD